MVSLYSSEVRLRICKAQRPLSDLEQQGLIQGFEFTHELGWNFLKDYLEMEGIQGLVGSRSTAREAFKRGLVPDGEVWMDMIEKRNLSSHTYNQAVANTLVVSIAERYYPGTHRPGSDIDLTLFGDGLDLDTLGQIATRLDESPIP